MRKSVKKVTIEIECEDDLQKKNIPLDCKINKLFN